MSNPLRIHVLAFAQLREVLGCDSLNLELPSDSVVADVWNALLYRAPKLHALADSVRVARNGAMVEFENELADGDDVAFLPPFGGG